MAIHDWTRVPDGIFHDFHQRWIYTMSLALNDGLLPGEYDSLVEQVIGGPIPDVVTLERVIDQIAETDDAGYSTTGGGLAVVDSPPKVKYTHNGDLDVYAARVSRIAVQHVSGDRVVAYIEIVSPGNKYSDIATQKFVNKLQDTLRQGCHALIIDLHPPTTRDPRGVHARFWRDSFGDDNAPGTSKEQPLTLVAYRSDLAPTAYFEPVAVGDTLIDMPIFLTPDRYINVPLEATYQAAYRGVPRRWKQVVEESL